MHVNCLCFNVNTFGIPMCAQLPVTYNLWEGPEDDWITVETCSPIVISENKCCADVKTDLFLWSSHVLHTHITIQIVMFSDLNSTRTLYPCSHILSPSCFNLNTNTSPPQNEHISPSLSIALQMNNSVLCKTTSHYQSQSAGQVRSVAGPEHDINHGYCSGLDYVSKAMHLTLRDRCKNGVTSYAQ
jgi:hypothetical protein